MKESTLLKPNIFDESFFGKNETKEDSSDSECNTDRKLDYIGEEFVYDDYNQNPDLVKENKYGYKVFFTRDIDLLEKYYTIRMNALQDRLGFKKFNKLETDFDKKGRIMVVLKEGEIIGGMRLMFSDECGYFSSERPGTQFQYEKVVRRYHDDRENLVNVEVSGLASSEDGRDFSAVKSMYTLAIEHSIARSCNYIFGVASPSACRVYRIVLGELGHYLEIILSYPWERREIYHFTQMFPSYIKLK